jgi:hypothetical protein
MVRPLSPTGAPGAASGFDMDSATLALPTMTTQRTNDAPHGHQGLEEATEPGGHHAPARPRSATAVPTAGRAAPGIAELVADLREVLVGAGIAVTTAWAQLVTRGVRALRPRLATRPGLVIALERVTPSLQSPLALVGAADSAAGTASRVHRRIASTPSDVDIGDSAASLPLVEVS